MASLEGRPFHIEKVYELFMNFLPALYEFSNVMEFDHQRKAAGMYLSVPSD
jgi:hypothetical protein